MNAESSIHALVISWHEIFGDQPTHPRYLIELAFYSEARSLREALLGILPSLAEQPHHATIIRWLKQQENIPLTTDDERKFRFVRAGHKWRLAPIHNQSFVQDQAHAA